MLSPALRPEHALLLTFPSTGRLPSAISATDFSRLRSMLHRDYAAVRLLVCSSTASSPRLPVAARDRQATAGQTRSPRFRRDPFVRDVASDPGRATVPRIAAPHMLPSAVATASAPAISRISWLNPTPQTITVYASPWSSPSTPQHSLPSGRYPLPGPDFHRLDHASFAWRTATPSPWGTCTSYSLPVLIGAPEFKNFEPAESFSKTRVCEKARRNGKGSCQSGLNPS